MDFHPVTIVLGAFVALILVNFFFFDNQPPRVSNRASRNFVVTDEMIETVRAIGPGLTTLQIKADLQLTGSVEATIDRYLRGSIVSTEDITPEPVTKLESSNTNNLLSDNDGNGMFNGLTFDQMKRKMILENRKKYEAKYGTISI